MQNIISRRVAHPVLPRLANVPTYLLLSVYSLFVLTLVAWVVLASFSPTRDIFTGNLMAFNLTLKNYRDVLGIDGGLWNIANTLGYVVPSCILTILVSAPAAYALARFPGNGNRVVETLLVLCMGIPTIIITLSIFQTVTRLGIADSRLVLIVLYTATHVPFNVYFLTSYFRTIPSSYEEAAMLEGAGPFRVFWEIMLPFVKPAIFTLMILNFIGLWNEYLLALIFANTNEMRPIGIWLQATINSMNTTGNWAGMFAAVVVAAAPTVVIYAVLADRLIGARTASGLK